MIEQSIDNNGILTITLNRPEKLNALNQHILQNLYEMIVNVKEDANIKAMLLTGTGKAFCAGADIEYLAACNIEGGYEFACYGQQVFNQLANLRKPVLIAINGYAFGGGCELAIAGHLRVATENAKFGQPEVKLGLIPGYGGTQRLAKLIGKGRALDLCITGRFIDAKTALQWGLITDIFSEELLIENSKKILINILTTNAPLAIASVIEVIEHGYDLPLSNALHLEAVHFSRLCASSDKNEGVNAFLTKRSAKFQGN